MKNRSLLCLYTIFIFTNLFSLEEQKPLWVEFEEAKTLFENGNFQDALEYFLEVTKNEINFPEAEYMIGLLYLEEGELEIAEEQVKKAIKLAPFLQSPQEILDYKYTLAQIYVLKDDYDSYVFTLEDILGREEVDLQEVRDQKAYFDVLIESGINRLLHLYRKKADNVLNARVYLGYYYNSKGEYKESVNYLLSPILALLTEVINDNVLNNREYEFLSVENLFSKISTNKRIEMYFIEHDFYKLFYYLGESLFGMGYKDRANEIWLLLANSDISLKWKNKAKQQLKDPVLEYWKFVY